jgi:Flp pilus assembly protein TadG
MRVNVKERGSSLPEAAIVMSVLLALLFGIIDFGRATYTYAYVAQVARQGARWMIVRGSQCSMLDHCNAHSADVQTYVRGLSQGATDQTQLTATAGFGGCPAGSLANNGPGCTVSVTVNYPFTFMLPYMPKSHGQLLMLNITSTSQMVISQ